MPEVSKAVNEKLAHDFWPDGAALGKRIRLRGEKQMRDIVGIARTANYSACLCSRTCLSAS